MPISPKEALAHREPQDKKTVKRICDYIDCCLKNHYEGGSIKVVWNPFGPVKFSGRLKHNVIQLYQKKGWSEVKIERMLCQEPTKHPSQTDDHIRYRITLIPRVPESTHDGEK